MRKIYLTLLALITMGFIFSLSAQISQDGTPLSFSLKEKSELKSVPFEIMPSVDIEALKREDVYNDQLKDQPWRFGHNMTVNINPKNSGVWDNLADGSRLWRLGIKSKGALTLNLTFDNYRLPKGATLFIYNENHSEVIGAFTDFNNQEDRYFATTLVQGESITIEYYEPANADFPGELNLWRVTHGYRSVFDFAKTFGQSGDCNVNAVCASGDPIRDQIRSVAMLVSGGSGFCTGALINNTNNDGTPYFLSANHCYTTPGTVVFWFNWQSASCTNPGTSPAYNSVSGAVDKATYATSDFWLMQLNTAPPAGYNVYYSGWNHTTDAVIATKVWGIHHPSGDIKKISWCNAGVTTSAYLGATGDGTDHWRIGTWSDLTTTEPGSSGSPLFDTQGRIIGQLHGGYAACGNTLADYYGKLGTSWTGGGTSSTRLSNWLDPASSGAVTLNGYDPNAIEYDFDAELLTIVSPLENYNELTSIIPAVSIKNKGNNAIDTALVTYYIDTLDAVSFQWTGNLATSAIASVSFPSIDLTVGEHVFVAKVLFDGDENPGNDSLVREFTVLDCGNYTIPVVEGFNSTTLNACWSFADVTGTSGDLSFVTNGSSPTCVPNEGSHMLRFNSYSASSGHSVRLMSPSISTLGFDSISVNFDWHQDIGYSSDADKVTVQYSFDGTTWVDAEEFLRYNSLETGWQSKTVVIPAEADHKASIYFGFLFTSEYGNNCHFDNLVIDATTIDEPYPDFTASPLNSAINDTIIFTDASLNGPYTYYQWNYGEGALPETDTGIGPHKVVYTTLGLKTVSLTLDSLYTKTKTDYISVEDFAFPAPYALSAFVDDRDVSLSWNSFFDDFESGNFNKWSEIIEGPGTTGDANYPYWFVFNDYLYEGVYNAQVNWGYTINTWLISPELPITSSSSFSFWWESSYYWHVSPYRNGLFTVEISTDGGSSWDPIWNFVDIPTWENWTWYKTTIDLSAYADQNILIAFHVTGDDNADVALENIEFNQNTKVNSGTIQVGDPAMIPMYSKSNRTEHPAVRTPFLKIPALDEYAIYRDGAEIGTSSTTAYFDNQVALGVYEYYVVANYTNPVSASEPSNTIEVNVTGISVEEKEKTDLVRLYPNPSDGIFKIEADREYHVTVINMSGSIVDILTVNPASGSIDLGDQQEGIFILKFKSDETTFERKVIIN
jgi:lysyl endopeptidase